jgi:hypothetical protein
MSGKVDFKTIIKGLTELNATLRYSEIAAPFEAIITDRFYETNVTKTASEVSRKNYIDIHSDFVSLTSGGLLVNYNYEVCGLCYRPFNGREAVREDGMFTNLKVDGSSLIVF